jgi:predicted MFS family arabinose efflux permease
MVEPMTFARYRAALRAPQVARILFTSLIARASQGMSGLSIVLLVARHQGYGRAGLVTGLYVLVVGAVNPLLARAVDRVGPRPVLLPCAAVYAAAMSAFAVVPSSAYPAMVGAAAVAGATVPPVVATVRGIWPRLLDESVVASIYALEATAQELIFIVGPALVAIIAGLAGPRTAVVVTGLLTFSGTVALLTVPAMRARPERSERVRHRMLRTTRLPVYVALGAALCLGFNMCDIAVVAFVGGRHSSVAAGVVLAMWSLGSFIGGLWFGASRRPVDEKVVAAAILAIAASMAAASLAPGRVGLAAILCLGGMTVAPGLGRLYTRVSAVAPDGGSTEAFAWMGVGLMVGASVGASLGGVSVDAIGPRATFLLASAAPAASALVLLRSVLRGRSGSTVRRAPAPRLRRWLAVPAADAVTPGGPTGPGGDAHQPGQEQPADEVDTGRDAPVDDDLVVAVLGQHPVERLGEP